MQRLPPPHLHLTHKTGNHTHPSQLCERTYIFSTHSIQYSKKSYRFLKKQKQNKNQKKNNETSKITTKKIPNWCPPYIPHAHPPGPNKQNQPCAVPALQGRAVSGWARGDAGRLRLSAPGPEPFLYFFCSFLHALCSRAETGQISRGIRVPSGSGSGADNQRCA